VSTWIESSIPFVAVFVMLIVGTDLRIADFQRVRRYPVLVPGIVCGQWVLLIGVAGLVGRLLDLPPGMTGGAILLAAAPVAAMSGFYTQLAGGHLALAVTVAAVSNLLAPIFTPVAASLGFWLFLDSDKAMELPILRVALQSLLGLLLPLLAGMALRHGAPEWVARWRGSLQGIALVVVLFLLGMVIVDQRAAIHEQFALLFGGSLLFTLATLAAGWLVLRLTACSANDRRGLLWGFPARNVAVATLAATSVLGKAAVVTFIAVLFATQLTLLLPLALWLRKRGRYPSDGV
jgi:BASS family bile acid:Na+ symporter